MVDIQRQIDYWRTGATDDWRVAQRLVAENETLHGLFFVHLTREKLLKAHVCKATKELAPRIHNLLRLAEFGNIILSSEQKDFLEKINLYNLEGRYPDMDFPVPSRERATQYLKQAKEITEWLTSQL